MGLFNPGDKQASPTAARFTEKGIHHVRIIKCEYQEATGGGTTFFWGTIKMTFENKQGQRLYFDLPVAKNLFTGWGNSTPEQNERNVKGFLTWLNQILEGVCGKEFTENYFHKSLPELVHPNRIKDIKSAWANEEPEPMIKFVVEACKKEIEGAENMRKADPNSKAGSFCFIKTIREFYTQDKKLKPNPKAGDDFDVIINEYDWMSIAADAKELTEGTDRVAKNKGGKTTEEPAQNKTEQSKPKIEEDLGFGTSNNIDDMPF